MDKQPDNLLTLRDYVRWGASQLNEAGSFFGHGTDNAVDESVALVLHVLHLQPDLPDHLYDATLTSSEREAVLEILQRRINERLPAAYLTGETWFAGLSFQVDERVLIPRSPIAELIETGYSPWLDHLQATSILDIGTGSGCIAIASALVFPDARVDAADTSQDALDVTTINIAQHGLVDRVRPVLSDVYEQFAGQCYDLIVSNPPYVTEAEMLDLPDEYRHEPESGLVAGQQGLDVVRRILAGAASHLNDQGVLIVEVGNSQQHVMDAWPEVPFLWLEFERGDGGVFLLDKDQLEASRDLFLLSEEV